ncbi:MAG: hypothetical protein H7196_04285 [candidate division SR1 bacterium]|nr:hypothetical protein [candidate division SR1 bacterium]
MLQQAPTFIYTNILKSNTLNIIVHGGKTGINDPFLEKIYNRIIEAKLYYNSITI